MSSTGLSQHFFPEGNLNPSYPKVTILDVTLRDGSFSVDFQWKEETIRKIVQGLSKVGIPYIELGYWGGIPKLHNVFYNGITADFPLTIVKELVTSYPETKFVLMIHPSALEKNPDFAKLQQAGISMVRFVYHPDWHEKIKYYVTQAKESRLEVSINMALATRYKREALVQLCYQLAALQPHVLYLADTCSAFYPNQIQQIFQELAPLQKQFELGFHPHDFLSLAFANALSAAQMGVSYIDSSLLGIGRSAGNLSTELWCTTAKMQRDQNFDLAELVQLCTFLSQKKIQPQKDTLAILAGAYNLTPPEEDFLRETVEQSEIPLGKIVQQFSSNFQNFQTESMKDRNSWL